MKTTLDNPALNNPFTMGTPGVIPHKWEKRRIHFNRMFGEWKSSLSQALKRLMQKMTLIQGDKFVACNRALAEHPISGLSYLQVPQTERPPMPDFLSKDTPDE